MHFVPWLKCHYIYSLLLCWRWRWFCFLVYSPPHTQTRLYFYYEQWHIKKVRLSFFVMHAAVVVLHFFMGFQHINYLKVALPPLPSLNSLVSRLQLFCRRKKKKYTFDGGSSGSFIKAETYTLACTALEAVASEPFFNRKKFMMLLCWNQTRMLAEVQLSV